MSATPPKAEVIPSSSNTTAGSLGGDRGELGEYFITNWNRLFGTIRRSKALEETSDQLRKRFMIYRLLDLIEMRRAEYADERAVYGR